MNSVNQFFLQLNLIYPQFWPFWAVFLLQAETYILMSIFKSYFIIYKAFDLTHYLITYSMMIYQLNHQNCDFCDFETLILIWFLLLLFILMAEAEH